MLQHEGLILIACTVCECKIQDHLLLSSLLVLTPFFLLPRSEDPNLLSTHFWKDTFTT